LLFLTLAVTLDIDLSWVRLLHLAALTFVSSIGVTALGFVIAWRMESTQGFHAIMTVFLMPLWLLSGAFFPVPALTPGSAWTQVGLHWLMKLNPLTYTVAGVHRLLFNGPLAETLVMPGMTACWAVTSLFSIVMFAAAWRMAGTRTRGDLV
jgi:ABC-2 type transport system permease protein